VTVRASRSRFTYRELVGATGALLLLWQLAALWLATPLLPAPISVALALWRAAPGDLGRHTLASLYRVVVSIAAAILVAAPLGLVLGQSARLNRLCAPLIYLLYPIPKVVLAPVVLLLFGVGEFPKIFLIFMLLFFQILVLVRDAAAELRPELLLSVRSLGAGRRALLRFVYLPATLPAILTAVRQSIGTAVAVLYVAELFATRWGLGYYIYLNGSTLFDYPMMYAGIVTMSLLGLGLYFSVDWVERRVCRWRDVR